MTVAFYGVVNRPLNDDEHAAMSWWAWVTYDVWSPLPDNFRVPADRNPMPPLGWRAHKGDTA